MKHSGPLGAIIAFFGRVVGPLRNTYKRSASLFAACVALCTVPFLMDQASQIACAGMPETLRIGVHESVLDKTYRTIPVEVCEVVDELFADGAVPSKYAYVTFYLFMYQVYTLVRSGAESPILRKAFSRTELRALSNKVRTHYGSNFTDLSTQEFARLVLTKRAVRYVSSRILEDVKMTVGDTRITMACPWLCILRKMKLILGLKYQDSTAAEFAIRTLQQKGMVLVREDALYELESGENWSGKKLTPERCAYLKAKAKRSGVMQLGKLSHQDIVLLRSVSSVFSLASARYKQASDSASAPQCKQQDKQA